MATRTYRQRLRADTAEETRRRILDAVYRLLSESPAEPLAVERVAALAEVSRSTVYLAFGSRAGLFDALGDDLRSRGGFDRMPDAAAGPDAEADPDAAAARDATAEPDARQHLADSIRASVPIFAEHRKVLRVLYSMAQLDPESVGGAVQRMGEARAAGMRWHTDRLAAQQALRSDVTPDEAAHLLWATTGFEFFDQLHTGRALPPDQVADLMVAAAERAVLKPGR